MCWWGQVEVVILVIQAAALVGLFYLNYKNRIVAKKALECAYEVDKHTKNTNAIMGNALGQPPPPSVPGPKPSLLRDLEERDD